MPPKTYVAHFTRVFAGAHRVWNDPGICRNIHGHNYTVNVEVQTDALTPQGFTTPFEAMKAIIDEHDHALILDSLDPLSAPLAELLASEGVTRIVLIVGPPSTERLADRLAYAIAGAVLNGNPQTSWTTVVLSLRETAGIEATAQAALTRRP